MFQSMEECTEFIFGLRASMYKGAPLESARIILEALGNPQQQTKFIHFAGSNGKGSTLNATRAILMAHGLRVAAFTSPHLERANERITINHEEISDDRFLLYTNRIAAIVEKQLEGQFPSFFEMVTLIALQHFAEEDVDVALMETGIGGRLDSTNVITPEVSVITTISLEHTDLLGNTHALIAAEKAGIIKKGKPVVIGVKNEEALAVIEAQAEKLQARTYILGTSLQLERTGDQSFHLGDLKNIEVAMRGTHQLNNAALAIQACALFLPKLDAEKVRAALRTAKWDGRFEYVSPQIILDGAHNAEGTLALIETLQLAEPTKKYHFIYAALQDKDHATSVQLMDTVASTITFTQIALPRAASAERLGTQSKHKQKVIEPNWQAAIDRCMAKLGSQDCMIITGSLYFIAEARSYVMAKGGIR